MKTHLLIGIMVGVFQPGWGYEFRIDKRCSTFVHNPSSMRMESVKQGGSKMYQVGSSVLSDDKRIGFWKEAKNLTGMTQEHIETEDGENVYVLELPENEEKELFRMNWHFPSKPTKTLDELVEEGKRKFVVLLPTVAGEFRYANHEVEYEGIEGDKVITEVRLRFSRLLEDAEIMKSISYLSMDMDGRGKVKRIKTRYPEIIEASKRVNAMRSSEEILQDLTLHCNSKSHIKPLGKEATERTNKTEVTASIRSWIPLASEDGDILLTPSISFYSQMVVDVDDKFSKVIHVPLDKSIYIDDNRTGAMTRKSKDNGVYVQRGTQFAPVIKSGR